VVRKEGGGKEEGKEEGRRRKRDRNWQTQAIQELILEDHLALDKMPGHLPERHRSPFSPKIQIQIAG
jgi:hypothetical protein